MYHVLVLCLFIKCITCNPQVGPDPWDDVNVNKNILEEDDLPPDLKIPKQIAKIKPEPNKCMSDWFYKRLLAIILKGGQRKENEDDTIDVSLQMKFSLEQFNSLDEYILSNNALSENMLRRSIGHIEESIYKPTITERITMAWSEYVYTYIIEYKEYITWSLTIAAMVAATCWLWQYVSYKHMLIFLGVALYLYEVFVSYKEAEKKEVNRFISGLNSCKWQFWTSECVVSPPDPIIMLKHMNPLKIAARMFTTIISEPMITISDTVNTIVLSITDDLMWPVNTIVHVILVIAFVGMLLMLLVGIVFNYILNTPFQLNLFYILSIAFKQRNGNEPPKQTEQIQGDRITNETLNRFLDLCSQALTVSQNNKNLAITNSSQSRGGQGMKRSASTGRLPSIKSNLNEDLIKRKHGGSGDS
ncbi:uncharacterized protein LOC110998505 [Pieris rapae]|uniref:uncharacterized protein LOC110998505 n=1 Tax=Pieris rapae TaxID=64459 RepID=UPI001E27CCEB|nr:uncharacterized protein LOC110998505 [Pieris rapae]